MENQFGVPACPDVNDECLADGFDIQLHIAPDGTATVVSSTPSHCSRLSPHNFFAMLHERRFRAFEVAPASDEEEPTN
jgi:hypothetical protein